MAGFYEWAAVSRIHDGTGCFRLTRDLAYRSDAGDVYVVPNGFKTDLASVPKIVWPILPPHGLYLSAAILHDFFCENDWISRTDGDRLFKEAMSHSNVPTWKAWTIWFGVRAYAILNRLS